MSWVLVRHLRLGSRSTFGSCACITLLVWDTSRSWTLAHNLLHSGSWISGPSILVTVFLTGLRRDIWYVVLVTGLRFLWNLLFTVDCAVIMTGSVMIRDPSHSWNKVSDKKKLVIKDESGSFLNSNPCKISSFSSPFVLFDSKHLLSETLLF